MQMESVRVDKDGRRILAVLDLEGEADLVDVTAVYELAETTLSITGVETSRPWMTGVLALILEVRGAHFPLPDGMQGMMIKMVL